MRRAAVVAAVVCMGAAMAGCRGDDDAGPSTTAGTTTTRAAGSAPVAVAPTVPSADVFAALAGDDPAALERVLPAMEPGSPAARYVDYLAEARQLTGTAGCGPNCPAYSDAEYDPASGRLAGFAVDGMALAGRVAGAGPEVTSGSLAVHVAGAYLTTSGDVFVVVAARNSGAEPAELFGFAATYQTEGSPSASDAAASWGDPVVPAGGAAQLLVEFAGASALGGTLRLSGVAADGIDVTATLEVPTL